MSARAERHDRAREGQTFAGRSRLVHYINLVKLPHTLFALPFALVGVVLASRSAPVTVREVVWVVVAFSAARFAAMGFNRIADARIDALNPRTRGREIPAGRLSVAEASVSVVVASALFLLAAWRLNPLCLALAPFALAWVLGYSYAKRFTRWSHLVLGAGLGIAPVGGYLAVAGAWSRPWWLLPALAAAVMCWVAGFDVLYALQDVTFDRAQGLRSVPAAVGERGALLVARVLHGAAVVLLAATGIGASAGWLYALGVVVVALLLIYEHRLVSPDDLSRLDAAFFTMNGIISIAFLAFVLAGRLVHS
ncbi:MAG TPA: UbiA-like polyprenyltransferase [Gemmatimonadaceae bacterium]|nr:UbiA-like polyprenyltransferase [Gemmatimonadaceae bacterium]